MTGCGAGFEGSGSKDAASAEQLAMRLDDPWAQEVQADQGAKAEGELADGVYTGTGKGMEGLVTVKLLVQDNRISCLETAQEGESQSRGGYEAIRDGRFAAMIEAAQGAGIDAISGATITTAGVRQAVEDALSQAEAAAAKQEQGGIPMTKQVHGQTGAHAPLSRRDFLTRAGLTVGAAAAAAAVPGAAYAVQEGVIGDWAADGSKAVDVPDSAVTNASWSDGTYREHNGAAFPADDASPIPPRAAARRHGIASATSVWWARAAAA